MIRLKWRIYFLSFILIFLLVQYAWPAEQGDFLYRELEQGIIITQYKGKDLEVTIPSIIQEKTVIGVAEGAFSGCDTIQVVTLPEGIETINMAVFYNCKNLNGVIIPETVKRIENYAFGNCISLQMVLLPKDITHIGDKAFLGCKKLIIRGSTDSYGQQYAKKNNFIFFPIDHTDTIMIQEKDQAEQVLQLVNAERRKAGVNPLRLEQQLTDAANTRAQELVVSFSHTRPDGNPFFTVMNPSAQKNYTLGENIAMGQLSAEEVVTLWMNSPGHRRNILDARYLALGVGHCKNEANDFWVQLFMKKPQS